MNNTDRLDLLSGHDLDTNFAFPQFASVGQTLRITFQIYRDNFNLVAKIVFALYLPVVFAQSYLSAVVGWQLLGVVANLLSIFVLSLLEAALIFGLIVRLNTGADPTLAECFRWGMKKWALVFGVSLLSGLLTGLGMILLIIPGVILFLMYSLAIPIAVLQNVGVLEALQRSAQMTKGYRWRIFGTLFLFWLINTGVTWLVMGSFAISGVGTFWASLIVGVSTTLLQAVSVILSLVIYLGIQRYDHDAGLVEQMYVDTDGER